jgi:hypothetical protein
MGAAWKSGERVGKNVIRLGALLGRVFFESDPGEREFKMAENGVSLVKINLRLMKTL